MKGADSNLYIKNLWFLEKPYIAYTLGCVIKKRFSNFNIPRPGVNDPLEIISFEPNLKCLS